MNTPIHPSPQPFPAPRYAVQQYADRPSGQFAAAPPPRPGRPEIGRPFPPRARSGQHPGQYASGQYHSGQHQPRLPHPLQPAAPIVAARRPRRTGRIVVTVLLLVIAGLVGVAVLVGRAPAQVPAPDVEPAAQPAALSVFDLLPGDCYSTKEAPPAPGESRPVSYVESTDCSAPHTNQVISMISYGSTEDRRSVLGSKVDDDCTNQFRVMLDPTAFGDPTLKPGRIVPADDSTWRRKPVVSCVVFSDVPITRSLVAPN